MPASASWSCSLFGCGLPLITFQTEEAAARSPKPVSTGSIDKRPVGFGSDLGAEDWRRANAALAVALDPQGNGRPVKWDNPETALRGAVNPTGLPYVANDHICRDFLASVIAPQKQPLRARHGLQALRRRVGTEEDAGGQGRSLRFRTAQVSDPKRRA